MEQSKVEFDSIFLDIKENYENIIKKIEMEPFKAILGKYYSKIENFG